MTLQEHKTLMHSVLTRFKPKTDYLDIRRETIRALCFGYSNDRLIRLEQIEETGFSVRACIRGGWGFASLNNPARLAEYAGLAVEMAGSLTARETNLAPVVPVRDTVVLDIDEDPRHVTLDDKLALFRGFIDTGRSVSGDIDNVSAGYCETFRTICLMTSEGTDLVMNKMDIGGSVAVQVCKNSIMQSQAVPAGSSRDFGVIRHMADKIEPASRKTLELVRAKRVRAGRYTVVADPVLGSTFVHEAFGHASEADEYQNNPQMRDIFCLGRRFGGDALNIYDSGLVDGSRGAIRYDDEGVPAEKTWLIQNGILTGRLHNRESAALFNEPPTGNARCLNYRYPPICRMRTTCIAPGTAGFDDLIADIKLGVYAVDTLGGTGGEMFSFDAGYGIMIRNGRLEETVRDVQLSGNLFSTLKNIDAIGNDFTLCDDNGGCGKGVQFPLETSAASPHLRIRDITVGGS
jgi:TldD protein